MDHTWLWYVGTLIIIGGGIVRSIRLTREGLRAKREKAALAEVPPETQA